MVRHTGFILAEASESNRLRGRAIRRSERAELAEESLGGPLNHLSVAAGGGNLEG